MTYFYITDDGYIQPGKSLLIHLLSLIKPSRDRVRVINLAQERSIQRDVKLIPCRYTYDLPLPPRSNSTYVRPHPHDDEVESFAVSRLLRTAFSSAGLSKKLHH